MAPHEGPILEAEQFREVHALEEEDRRQHAHAVLGSVVRVLLLDQPRVEKQREFAHGDPRVDHAEDGEEGLRRVEAMLA